METILFYLIEKINIFCSCTENNAFRKKLRNLVKALGGNIKVNENVF